MVSDDVRGADVGDEGVTLHFAERPAETYDALVVAVGNLPPHAPPGLDPAAFPVDLYAHDPWDPAVVEGLTDGDTVLLIGTGLTMVDVALSLDAAGFGGRIVAMSRRGLLPRPHVPPGPPGDRNEKPTTRASLLLREIRQRSAEIGWRAAVDELRPFTQGLWLSATVEERTRFMRHLRPWWDVHRHRLAPAVAGRSRRCRRRGGWRSSPASPCVSQSRRQRRRRMAAASCRCQRNADRPPHRQLYRPAGRSRAVDGAAAARLIAGGHARADANRLGLDVDSQSRLIGADGEPHPRLFGLGPMTRGAFWEIVAVPDIRTQVWTVARRLAQAHWVGGEGL